MNNTDIITKFFTLIGLSPDQLKIEEKPDLILISLMVPPSDSGRYIGRFAATLDSLQLILSLMINNGKDNHLHIQVDVGGYREDRLNTLKSMADRLASLVIETNMPHEFPALSSTDRRQIHLLFQDHESLTTYSEGEGIARRLVLAPKAQ